MIGFPAAVRVFLAIEPHDMRKCQGQAGRAPLAHHRFGQTGGRAHRGHPRLRPGRAGGLRALWRGSDRPARRGTPPLLIHWIHQAIELVLPVAQAIRTETLANDYLQSDETTARYLRPGTGKSWLGYLWQVRCPGGGGVFFHWGVGRSCDELVECIGRDFTGHLQCDAYTVYETYARPRPEVRLIGQLYRIEADLREKKAGPALRESVRAWQSAPLARRIGKMLRVLLPKHRPASATGKALAYAVRHWEKFERYLEDGRFEIDNNLTENGMRPVKLGMKNWLFFGAEKAGHHAAAIYTLVENCKALGLPVESYLKELLSVLPGVTDPEVIASLTPARVAMARRPERARRRAA